MKPIKLHHSSIRIADLERSRQFYEGFLGLSAIERPDLGIAGRWYGIGGGQLHLIQAPPIGMAIDPSGPHFAIEVDDLDAARREIAAAGMQCLDPGGDQLWVLDPDGNTVELTGRRSG